MLGIEYPDFASTLQRAVVELPGHLILEALIGRLGNFIREKVTDDDVAGIQVFLMQGFRVEFVDDVH